MRTFTRLCIVFLLLISAAAWTAELTINEDIPEKVNISEETIKKILRKNGFSRVKIIEVDYEIYQNKKVYEVDFKYKGKVYEAVISLNLKFIYSQIDTED